jgi:uncharacterized protein
MKIVISPAKTLDFESPLPTQKYNLPSFLEETEKINISLKRQSPKKLSGLMDISKALAELNFERNQTRVLEYTPENARQAVFAFKGDVYLGLDANTLKEEQIPQLENKLRILSGLYGLLKPLDLIQPYRLEMGTSLKIGRRENLYKFWDDKITKALNSELLKDEPFINLASNEYFSAVKPKLLKVPVITPIFKDNINGKLKVVSFHAKKARGMMVRFILDHNLEQTEDLKAFNSGGYGFDVRASTATELVFTR